MKPPFRADQVGSLLRPKELAEARRNLKGEKLREVEDRCIRDAIARQEAIGLQSITDGEYRRAWWHFDFLGELEGVDLVEVDQGIQFAGVTTKAQAPRVMSRLDFADHPMLAHFRYLREHVTKTPKMTIP